MQHNNDIVSAHLVLRSGLREPDVVGINSNLEKGRKWVRKRDKENHGNIYKCTNTQDCIIESQRTLAAAFNFILM